MKLLVYFTNHEKMKYSFDRDLTEQKIYATGPELAETMWKDRDDNWNKVYYYPHTEELLVATLDNPVLMTDNEKIANLQDYIAKETIRLLQQKPMRIVEYDGLRMEFEQWKYYGVWSPNIDTLLFCRAIKDENFDNIKNMIEVGSGPWFIAKYIWNKWKNIQEIIMSDINENAKKYFEDTNTDERAKFVLWDAKKYLEDKNFDLIVCNPPYIPRPHAIEDNAYEWLELLIYLIQKFDKELIINVSSLADDIINPILESSWAKIEQLDEMEVPLKVWNVLNNKEWLDFLVKEKWLKELDKDWHKYRQKLRILKLTK